MQEDERWPSSQSTKLTDQLVHSAETLAETCLSDIFGYHASRIAVLLSSQMLPRICGQIENKICNTSAVDTERLTDSVKPVNAHRSINRGRTSA